MKFEEQIQACFDLYPDLFQHRWEVLEHLFCHYGTGYHWENGELISCSKEYKNLKVILPEDGVAKPNKEYTKEKIKEEYRRLKKELGHYYQEYKNLGIDKLAKKYSDEGLLNMAMNLVLKRKPYLAFGDLWKEGSPLLNLPEDIKPDWLEGARETIKLLQEAKNITFPEGCSDRHFYLKDQKNNNKIIEKLVI